MADIRRFIGEGAHSGQQVDLYFIAPRVGTGTLTEVSMYRLAVTISVSGAQHTLSITINQDSQGKNQGTCTVTFDGKEETNATFNVDQYWINVTTKDVLPMNGRYAIWRNGRATDATTPAPFRPKGWLVPANADAKDLGYDPRLTGTADGSE